MVLLLRRNRPQRLLLQHRLVRRRTFSDLMGDGRLDLIGCGDDGVCVSFNSERHPNAGDCGKSIFAYKHQHRRWTIRFIDDDEKDLLEQFD